MREGERESEGERDGKERKKTDGRDGEKHPLNTYSPCLLTLCVLASRDSTRRPRAKRTGP